MSQKLPNVTDPLVAVDCEIFEVSLFPPEYPVFHDYIKGS